MRRLPLWLLVPLAMALAGCGFQTELDPLTWTTLPPLPTPLGLGGPFAGVANDVLVVAGGANFPVSLFRGGKKVWHDDVYVLARGSSAWLKVGKLKQPLAYGSTVTTRSGLLLLGGCDGTKCSRDVTLLAWDGTRLRTTPLPKLPKPCAFSAAALVNNVVYVAGGQDSMTPKAAMMLPSPGASPSASRPGKPRSSPCHWPTSSRRTICPRPTR